ncbi:MAG: hypothetical protein ABIO70_24770 [Pseudomonadota bacterium]
MRRAVLSLLTLLSACAGPLGVQSGEARLMLDDPHPITSAGPWLDPAWSPDGLEISVAGARHRGLFLVSAEGGEPAAIPGAALADGFRHRWLTDPARILCPRRGGHAALEVSLRGGAFTPVADTEPVFLQDDAAWLRGAEGTVTQLTPPGESFFDPQLSPDGRLLAVVGLASGLHVVGVASGLAVAHAPGGTRPAWTPDGAWLLFERVEDDGHRLTEGDLWALSAADGDQLPLTDDPGIERQPAVSPDGMRVAYLREGAVWVADLTQGVTP